MTRKPRQLDENRQKLLEMRRNTENCVILLTALFRKARKEQIISAKQ